MTISRLSNFSAPLSAEFFSGGGGVCGDSKVSIGWGDLVVGEACCCERRMEMKLNMFLCVVDCEQIEQLLFFTGDSILHLSNLL